MRSGVSFSAGCLMRIAGGGNFIEKFLRRRQVTPLLVRSHMGHLSIGGLFDDRQVHYVSLFVSRISGAFLREFSPFSRLITPSSFADKDLRHLAFRANPSPRAILRHARRLPLCRHFVSENRGPGFPIRTGDIMVNARPKSGSWAGLILSASTQAG